MGTAIPSTVSALTDTARWRQVAPDGRNAATASSPWPAKPTASCPTTRGGALYAGRPSGRRGLQPYAATFVEIGAWCGKSSVYIGRRRRGQWCRPLQPRPPPRLRGEPGRVGAPRPVAGRSGIRQDRHPAPLAPHHRRCRVEPIGDRDGGRFPHGGRSQWSTPLAFCFIDGGHGVDPAWSDYRGWTPHVRSGGWLAIHDVFPDPADGGRPPYDVWRAALASGEFVEDGQCGSLRVVRRV